MVRTAVSACAGILLPLAALVSVGCGTKESLRDQPDAAPAAIFADLQDVSPGPWQRLEAIPVAARTSIGGDQVPLSQSSPAEEALNALDDDSETADAGSTKTPYETQRDPNPAPAAKGHDWLSEDDLTVLPLEAPEAADEPSDDTVAAEPQAARPQPPSGAVVSARPSAEEAPPLRQSGPDKSPTLAESPRTEAPSRKPQPQAKPVNEPAFVESAPPQTRPAPVVAVPSDEAKVELPTTRLADAPKVAVSSPVTKRPTLAEPPRREELNRKPELPGAQTIDEPVVESLLAQEPPAVAETPDAEEEPTGEPELENARPADEPAIVESLPKNPPTLAQGPRAEESNRKPEMPKAKPIDEPTVARSLPPVELEEVEAFDEPRGRLPWANEERRITEEMQVVVNHANDRIRTGFQLAERGAIYSARTEFEAALQMIAQANDDRQFTRLYTNALTAGLTAIKEAGDFVNRTGRVGEAELARLIARHKTPILKAADPQDLTATMAAKRYYTYAQEQLGVVALNQMSGSMALFGMGKAAIASIGEQKSLQMEKTAQATAYYQAALMADSRNYRAANELAVLLAENGNLSRARDILVLASSQYSNRATWQNLAVVHARLGEAQLAQQARGQALATNQNTVRSGPTVQWLDPETFARTTSATDGLVAPTATVKAPPAPAAVAPAAETPATTAKPSSDWIPKLLRR